MRIKTLEEYINILKVKKIKHPHNWKFIKEGIYKSIWKGKSYKMWLFCIDCKEPYEQAPQSHLKGIGHEKCGIKRRADLRRKTKEQFIEDAIKIHRDLYDYQNVVYNNTHTEVKIWCKKCVKYFNQSPSKHLSGHGCQPCANELRRTRLYTLEEFTRKGRANFNTLFDYSLILEFKGVKSNVEVICTKHKKTCSQVAEKHMSGKNPCKDCVDELLKANSINRRIGKDEFIKRANIKYGEGRYDYTNYIYTTNRTPSEIKCNCCENIFPMDPANHWAGKGCRLCRNKTERKLHEYLLKIFPECILSFKQEWCKNVNHLPFDFYIPSLKIIIELDGAQHFKQISNWCSPLKNIKRDIFKMEKALENGFRIIRLLQEDVWNNDEYWLDTHLKPLLIESIDFQVCYISTKENLYEDHIIGMDKFTILEFVE